MKFFCTVFGIKNFKKRKKNSEKILKTNFEVLLNFFVIFFRHFFVRNCLPSCLCCSRICPSFRLSSDPFITRRTKNDTYVKKKLFMFFFKEYGRNILETGVEGEGSGKESISFQGMFLYRRFKDIMPGDCYL